MLHIYTNFIYSQYLIASTAYICSWNIINLFVHPANYKSLIRKYIYIPPNKWCRFILGLISEHTTIERCKTKKKIETYNFYRNMLQGNAGSHTVMSHNDVITFLFIFLFFHLHDAQPNRIIQYKVDFIIKSS